MSLSVPADQDLSSFLLCIPRECRHIIFGHVAAGRTMKARDTLRNWFEKQDIQEQIAEMKKTDKGNVAYVAGYNRQYEDEREAGDEQDDTAGVGQNGEGEDEVEEEDEDEEADELDDYDDSEDDEENDDDGEGEGEIMGGGESGAYNAQLELEDDVVSEGEDVELSGNSENMADLHNAAQSSVATHPTQDGNAQVSAAATPLDIVHADGLGADVDNSQEGDEGDGNEDAEIAFTGEDENAVATSTKTNSDVPATKVVVVKPHSKWRHVPKFMRFTQCPPEANLFLISKQLNTEVKAWFYNVATLKIDATASFLHFSFFELALTKLAEAPFSPMEHIKKAEITFVWDTTWIRAEESGFAGAVFPVFLQNRVDFVLNILLRAPELESVVIHWHDSAQDDAANQLRADTIQPFILQLDAIVDTVDHYIAPDAKPRARSRAGKQRLEFKAIIDNGCETF